MFMRGVSDVHKPVDEGIRLGFISREMDLTGGMMMVFRATSRKTSF